MNFPTVSFGRYFFLLRYTIVLLFFAQVPVFSQNLTANFTDTNEVIRLNKLAFEYRLVKPDSAFVLAKKALYISQKTKFHKGEAMSWGVMGNVLVRMDKPDAAREAYSKALLMRKGLGDSLGVAKVLINYSDLYAKLGKFHEAHQLQLRSYEIIKLTEDKKLQVVLYNNMGANYSDLDEYDKAVEFFLKGLRISEELKLTNESAKTMLNLSVIYLKLKDYKKAEQACLYTLDVANKTGNLLWKGVCFSTLGSVYQYQKKYNRSVTYYKEAIRYAEEMHDEPALLKRIINVGSMYLDKGNYDSSVYWLRRAMFSAGFSESPLEACKCYNDLALSYQGMGKSDSAIYFSLKEYNISVNLGVKSVLFNNYTTLSGLYASKKNYQQAFHYSQLALLERDSILDEEKINRIIELQEQFLSEKKEKQIALLQKRNVAVMLKAESEKSKILIYVLIAGILASMVLVLVFRNYHQKRRREAEYSQKKAELEQRALRAQMNPHFIFNSLNSIQRMYVEGKTDLANDLMSDFSNLIRKILDNSEKEKISLYDELETLKLYLEIERLRCGGLFNYKIIVDERIHIHEVMIPPLVFQPIAENAIWHGILPKRELGQIEIGISCGSTEGELVCYVCDNGVGLKNERPKKHESKGIRITEQRLGSAISLESAELGGTCAKFIILIK